MPQNPIRQDQCRQERLEPLREERRDRLRSAAACLAWEHGYAGISLGIIAVHAGLSRAQAASLYARVSDLIADTICVYLRAMARRVEDFALGWELAQPRFRPQVLEQLAATLLSAQMAAPYVQRLCCAPCGLTRAQQESLARARASLDMSVAGTLMACLPGLAAAPDEAMVLAQRLLCLLDMVAEEQFLARRWVDDGAAQSVAAAVIAMAPATAAQGTEDITPFIPREGGGQAGTQFSAEALPTGHDTTSLSLHTDIEVAGDQRHGAELGPRLPPAFARGDGRGRLAWPPPPGQDAIGAIADSPVLPPHAIPVHQPFAAPAIVNTG